MQLRNRHAIITAIGTTQILAFASSERWGLGALWVSSALALLAFAALMALRAPARRAG